jgi:hypothetical protein
MCLMWKIYSYNTCLQQPAIDLLLFLHVDDIFKTAIQSWKTGEFVASSHLT